MRTRNGSIINKIFQCAKRQNQIFFSESCCIILASPLSYTVSCNLIFNQWDWLLRGIRETNQLEKEEKRTTVKEGKNLIWEHYIYFCAGDFFSKAIHSDSIRPAIIILNRLSQIWQLIAFWLDGISLIIC